MLIRGVYPPLDMYATQPPTPPLMLTPSLNVDSNPSHVKLSQVLHCP